MYHIVRFETNRFRAHYKIGRDFQSLLDVVFSSSFFYSMTFGIDSRVCCVDMIFDNRGILSSIDLVRVITVVDYGRADDATLIDYLEISFGWFSQLSILCGPQSDIL